MTRARGVRRPGVRAVVAGVVVLALTSCAAPSAVDARRPHTRHHRSSSPAPALTSSPTDRPGHDGSSPGTLRPRGPVSRGWRVASVVDGDTVHVARRGRELTIRVLGIDTPETVDPSEPVQCYGPEATRFAQRTLAGRRVMLEFDPSQGRFDYYGRTLAYVWTVGASGRWLYDLAAVRRGFAFEYTYDQPYLWRPEFVRAEAAARATGRGLWSPGTCDGDPYRGVG